ncbi:hypothetical protein Ddc_24630 [Ditylenchus destructor]|nr:hypothetical protein Ddc_24630 [Ditylenchus destructor]
MVRPKTQQLLREAAGRVHRAQHGLGGQAQARVLGAPLYQIGAVVRMPSWLLNSWENRPASRPTTCRRSLWRRAAPLRDRQRPPQRLRTGRHHRRLALALVLRLAPHCRQHQGRAAPQRQPRQSQARHRKQNDGHPDHPFRGREHAGSSAEQGTQLTQVQPWADLLKKARSGPPCASGRSSHPCKAPCPAPSPALCSAPSPALSRRALPAPGCRQPFAEIGGQGRQVGCRAGPGRQGAACAVHQKAGPAGVQQGPQGRQHLVGAGRARLLVQQTGHSHAADARGLLLRRMLGLVGAQQQPGRGASTKTSKASSSRTNLRRMDMGSSGRASRGASRGTEFWAPGGGTVWKLVDWYMAKFAENLAPKRQFLPWTP